MVKIDTFLHIIWNKIQSFILFLKQGSLPHNEQTKKTIWYEYHAQ